ncbi:MAG: hypothetical protein DME12_09710 [Candidatus Rokuibacteriota bacterium]|nr:MAG: hypothetical protein DME12_09710 [Candidatus Rokubacteria bacterium]PYM66917.1 MAG: hypothetical protein DME11_05280 [Candidatus Rokubacteria bacterium]
MVFIGRETTMSPRTTSRRRLVIITLVALVALPALALATIVSDPMRVFTGQVGIGGTAPALARLDVRGDADTRIRIDGSKTSGLYFTRAGIDAGTFRSTATGLEVWTSNVTLALALQGTGAHFLGNLQTDGNISSRYQDVAEWVTGPPLPAGTVVVAQDANRAIASDTAYDTRVIGVVSDRPALLLGEHGADKIKIAHSGRLRVKVVAPVAAGDLLVASSISGHAMRSSPREVRPGTILGKALESLEVGRGAVLTLLTLQ